MPEIDVLGPYTLEPGSYAVALLCGGVFRGVLLMDPDGAVRRAWIDTTLPWIDMTLPKGVYQKMEFRHEDPAAVLDAIGRVLDACLYPPPEVDPGEYVTCDLYSLVTMTVAGERIH